MRFPGDTLMLQVQESSTNRSININGLIFDATPALANSAPVITSVNVNPSPAAYMSTLTATTTVSVVATDADSDPLVFAWTKVSGPGNAIFATPSAATSTVTLTAVGTYVLQASISDGKAPWVTSNLTVTVPAPAGITYVQYVGSELSSAAGVPTGRRPSVIFGPRMLAPRPGRWLAMRMLMARMGMSSSPQATQVRNPPRPTRAAFIL